MAYTLRTRSMQAYRLSILLKLHLHTGTLLLLCVSLWKGTMALQRWPEKKSRMQRGNVMLIPSWQWYEHGHEGHSPTIWLDGLDIPLFQAFPVNFAEGYSETH
jgi:gentisate 1,2-dioxygenase